MKRLLILGASFLQLPAIQKAKEMGLYVGVVDYNPNAIGIPYADEFFEVSTIDEEAVYQVAKKFKADGIMTLATDMPVRSLTYASNKLGLVSNSYETAIKATDKGEMIKCFEKNNVAHPWYYILNSPKEINKIVNKITYPCISKPTDNAGSRGVILINNKDELIDALNYSSKNGRSGNIIIEEYLKGKEVSVEVMVVNKEVNILQVTDKITTGAPHFVEIGHVQPSMIEENNLQKIKELATNAVKAIGINSGPAHVEIMLTENGPKMIELGARMGGDCITTHLVPLSTGIDMVKATIETCLGEKPDIKQKINKSSAICFFQTNKEGTIQSIEGIDEIKKENYVKNISFTKEVGEKIEGINNSTDRVGYIIVQKETPEEAIKICQNAAKKIVININ